MIVLTSHCLTTSVGIVTVDITTAVFLPMLDSASYMFIYDSLCSLQYVAL